MFRKKRRRKIKFSIESFSSFRFDSIESFSFARNFPLTSLLHHTHTHTHTHPHTPTHTHTHTHTLSLSLPPSLPLFVFLTIYFVVESLVISFICFFDARHFSSASQHLDCILTDQKIWSFGSSLFFIWHETKSLFFHSERERERDDVWDL